MDRITTGTLIAIATLVMTAGLGKDVLAREAVPPPAAALAATSAAAQPAGTRVLSLLLTLEALRAAPALLDTRKV